MSTKKKNNTKKVATTKKVAKRVRPTVKRDPAPTVESEQDWFNQTTAKPDLYEEGFGDGFAFGRTQAEEKCALDELNELKVERNKLENERAAHYNEIRFLDYKIENTNRAIVNLQKLVLAEVEQE